MRIVGGTLGGRRLKAGRGMALRPTSDKVREAVFDVLQNRVSGRRVLDVFAGTGAMGIEALSRGAKAATFVESSRKSLDLLRENVSSLGLDDRSKILALEAPKRLYKMAPRAGKAAEENRFDLIFIDPPYGKGLAQSTVEELERLDLVALDAIIVVEHGSRETISEEFKTLILDRRRVYSTTAVSFYERASSCREKSR